MPQKDESDELSISFFTQALCISYHAGERLSDFYINVSNNSDGSFSQECAYESEPFKNAETRVYVCEDAIYGQFVRIGYQENKTEVLQLCQVQIQGGMFL